MIWKISIKASQHVRSTTSSDEFESTNDLSDVELDDDIDIGDVIGTEGVEEEQQNGLDYESNGESPNETNCHPVLSRVPRLTST